MSEQFEPLQQNLATAITTTIESMTFEEVTVVTDETIEPYLGKDKLWAVLPVVTPYSGKLLIEVPMECCRVLAGEAYGELDEEPSIEQMQDLVGEIINTVAGTFLDELVPAEKVFQLGLPEKGQGELPDHSDEITSILLNVGDHYLNTAVVGKDFEQFNADAKQKETVK